MDEAEIEELERKGRYDLIYREVKSMDYERKGKERGSLRMKTMKK